MRIILLALSATVAASLDAQQAPTATPTIPAKWDVSARRATAKDLTFETSTGTWMSLDVSPDGRTIVFDLLDDIFGMPSRADRHTRAWPAGYAAAILA
jgi:hypothetical protein